MDCPVIRETAARLENVDRKDRLEMMDELVFLAALAHRFVPACATKLRRPVCINGCRLTLLLVHVDLVGTEMVDRL